MQLRTGRVVAYANDPELALIIAEALRVLQATLKKAA
jgi:hypothetical protein